MDAFFTGQDILGHGTILLGSNSLAPHSQIVLLVMGVDVCAGLEGRLAGHSITHLDLGHLISHCHYLTGKFMAQNHRSCRIVVFPLKGVDIRATNPGESHLDKDLVIYCLWNIQGKEVHLIIARFCLKDTHHFFWNCHMLTSYTNAV